MSKLYQIHEFAELAGVTGKALRHYDRLALLKPRRTKGGYRTYAERDLERLEQIIALKFLGIPLKQIKNIGSTGTRRLNDSHGTVNSATSGLVLDIPFNDLTESDMS